MPDAVDELRAGKRRKPRPRRQPVRPTTTPTKYVAAPRKTSKPTTVPTRYVAAPKGTGATLGTIIGHRQQHVSPARERQLHAANILHDQAKTHARRAKAGRPFDPRLVAAAIHLGIPDAHGLRVDSSGNIQRQFKRSLFGIDKALSDYQVVLDPKKGGEVPVGLAAHHAGVDAAGLKVLHEVARPFHAVAGLAAEGPHGFTEGLLHNKNYSFGKTLKKAGVPGLPAGVLGFALDVAADPTTYVSFGTASLARKAATDAAIKASTRAVRAGMSEAGAEAAAKAAAARAVEKASPGKGLTVKFGKASVPGVTRATAAAGRRVKKAAGKTPKRAKTAAAGARDVARDVRPQMRPAGTPEAEFVGVRHAGRQARAEARLGADQASQRARGLLGRLSKEEYVQVIDAIEHGKIRSLPQHLHEPAVFLRDEFRHAKRVRRQAGIPEGTIRNYFPHARADKLDTPDAIERAAVPPKGPRTVKGRKREIKKSISEVNAEQAAKGAGPLFSTNVPLVYAHYMTSSARDVARAKLFRNLAEVGDPVRPSMVDGERVWRIRELKPGEALYHVGPHEGRYGLREIKPNQLGKKGGRGRGGKYVILNKRLVDEQLSGITTADRTATGKVIDRTTAGFKRIATATPGFHVRNLIGDTQMAYLAQPGHRLPGNVVAGRRALNRLTQVEKAQRTDLGRVAATEKKLKVAGTRINVDEFLAGARKHGVIRSGYIGRELEELRGVGKARVGHGFTEKVKRFMQNREDLMRLATYKHGLDKGLTEAQAADLSLGIHIDYGDLTSFERRVARRAFPFYTFSARALPVHAKALVQHPGKFANIEKAREEAATATGLDLQDEEKKLRVYQKRQAPLILKIGGKKVVLSAALPLTLLNEVPATRSPAAYIDELAQWVASLSNPIIKDPVELYSNRSFFFRSDIQAPERPLVAAPSWVSVIYKHDRALADKLGIVPDYRDRKTGRKVWGWNGKTDYIAKSVPGLPNLLQQITSQGANRRGQTTTEKIIGGALGVKAEPLDPKGALLETLFNQLDSVTEKIGALNQRGVHAANATAEYNKLRAQEAKIRAALTKISAQRGDKDPLFSSSRRKASGYQFKSSSGGGNGYQFKSGASSGGSGYQFQSGGG